jgi:hypothetical protein
VCYLCWTNQELLDDIENFYRYWMGTERALRQELKAVFLVKCKLAEKRLEYIQYSSLLRELDRGKYNLRQVKVGSEKLMVCFRPVGKPALCLVVQEDLQQLSDAEVFDVRVWWWS